MSHMAVTEAQKLWRKFQKIPKDKSTDIQNLNVYSFTELQWKFQENKIALKV